MHTDIFLRIICQSVDAHAILVSTIPLPFCSCRFAVAVTKIPQELRKRRKHYVAYAKKNPLRRCRFHLPLRRNCRSVAIGSNPFLPFCRWWTTNQRSGHFIPMYTERRFQHFRSHAHAATVATERKNGNGTTERHNDTTEWRNCNGSTATEW